MSRLRMRKARRWTRAVLAAGLALTLLLSGTVPGAMALEEEETEEETVAAAPAPVQRETPAPVRGAGAATAQVLTPGVRNMVKRAYQLTDIVWVPEKDIQGWKDRPENTFRAGVRYTGIPYGQPHRSGSYVPWETGLVRFLREVQNPKSLMYSSRAVSQVKQNVSPYFSCECSAFVSWAWDLPQRETTHTLGFYGTLVSRRLEDLQVGDCLLQVGKHARLVTNIAYDKAGGITGIEISEERAPAARRFWYRRGDSEHPLTDLQKEVQDKDYTILRCNTRDQVHYTHSCVVPMPTDLCPYCGANPFRDIALDAWYTGAVAFVNNQGIMTGTSKRSFSPEVTVTRAMVVTMLWRMYYCPSREIQLPFRDLDRDGYYLPALRWSYAQGCVNGTDSRHFSPHDPCTRTQIVTFLWRAAGRPQASQTACPFTDVDRQAYYYPALLWSVEQGIIKGMTATTFAPDAKATRAETAAMIMRACKVLGLYQ